VQHNNRPSHDITCKQRPVYRYTWKEKCDGRDQCGASRHHHKNWVQHGECKQVERSVNRRVPKCSPYGKKVYACAQRLGAAASVWLRLAHLPPPASRVRRSRRLRDTLAAAPGVSAHASVIKIVTCCLMGPKLRYIAVHKRNTCRRCACLYRIGGDGISGELGPAGAFRYVNMAAPQASRLLLGPISCRPMT
jgi:hypothetical protein